MSAAMLVGEVSMSNGTALQWLYWSILFAPFVLVVCMRSWRWLLRTTLAVFGALYALMLYIPSLGEDDPGLGIYLMIGGMMGTTALGFLVRAMLLVGRRFFAAKASYSRGVAH